MCPEIGDGENWLAINARKDKMTRAFRGHDCAIEWCFWNGICHRRSAPSIVSLAGDIALTARRLDKARAY